MPLLVVHAHALRGRVPQPHPVCSSLRSPHSPTQSRIATGATRVCCRALCAERAPARSPTHPASLAAPPSHIASLFPSVTGALHDHERESLSPSQSGLHEPPSSAPESTLHASHTAQCALSSSTRLALPIPAWLDIAWASYMSEQLHCPPSLRCALRPIMSMELAPSSLALLRAG